jgi:succinate dehydrogenase / fumarate reductase, iron-sulfur subunit
MEESPVIKVTVLRYDPEENRKWEENFEVPFKKGMTALMALQTIREEHPISFRSSCGSGLCDICGMRINGKNRLACRFILHQPVDLYVEPARHQTVLRDLVTDLGSR